MDSGRWKTDCLLWAPQCLSVGSEPTISHNSSLASAMQTRRPRSRRDTPLPWFTGTLIRGGNHFASHTSKDYISQWMGTFSRSDEKDPLGQTIHGSPGSDGSLCVNYFKKNYLQQIGLDPITPSVSSQLLLEIEGSCMPLKSNLSWNAQCYIITCDFACSQWSIHELLLYMWALWSSLVI